jgi:tetratricopeptide (TPR) repeat protein
MVDDGSSFLRTDAECERDGDDKILLVEAALSRTRFELHEWCGALFDARRHLDEAKDIYKAGSILLFENQKDRIEALSQRIQKVFDETSNRIEQGNRTRMLLKSVGSIDEYIDSLEVGWLLRQEVHGKLSEQVQTHLEELIRALNTAASHLVSRLSHAPPRDAGERDARRRQAAAAHNLLQRAALLCGPASAAVADGALRRRLRAITLNNLGCLHTATGDLPLALARLEEALRVEVEVGQAEHPASTHLNLCAVLSRLGRHRRALEHAECAVALLQAAVQGGWRLGGG